MARLDDKKIKETVSEFYKDVAEGNEGTLGDKNKLGLSLGYTQEELDSVPDEANMGLGCGSPHEKANPQPGEVVLDLGCGKGMDVFIAAKKVGVEGRVIGVDMTEKMIETAKKIAKGRGFDNTEFIQGHNEDLPIEDNSIDLAISNCVINLSPDKQQVYNEIFRVLKPGGRIGISDTTLTRPHGDEILKEKKFYGTCVAGASVIEDLEEILRNAGFVEIDIDTKKVSPEYATKWTDEHNEELSEYMRSSIVTAYKPK